MIVHHLHHRLLAGLCLAVALSLSACEKHADPAAGQKVVVLGVDGMDHGLTRELIDTGQLPNLAKLERLGFSAPLQTSVPPLSPVAWSDFITGQDAGGHGIFDFIHRDPLTMQPYLSTSRLREDDKGILPRAIGIGDCRIPLAEPVQDNLRHGEPFWTSLQAAGINTLIMRMPSNYPVSGTAARELSGMGTPDLLGTYGTFSYYSTGLFVTRKSVDGGEIYPVERRDGRIEARLSGPPNPFESGAPPSGIDFSLQTGNDGQSALLEIGGGIYTLTSGQWSPWIAFEFELDCVPFVKVPGMARFYLRQIDPELELYVSPVNIDPSNAVQAISNPSGFATRLAEATGPFYTQGMMEDTKALSEGVLSRAEFLDQAALAGQEVERQFFHLLERFEDGLFFNYFGNLDQVSHMMFRHLDSSDPRADAALADVVQNQYREIDRIVGLTMQKLAPDDLLIVMSDHGFAPWRRSFHLNNWLLEQGYLVLQDPDATGKAGMFRNIDWDSSRAYGLGFNGLYINQKGRERDGIVPADQAAALVNEIAAALSSVVDPSTGNPAVTRTYVTDRYYKDQGQLATGPDMIVGYARGVRVHSDSAVGTVGGAVFSDNLDEWGGDHAMDHTTVPGVLFSNRPLRHPAASLRELSSSIMAEFEISGLGAGSAE